jgi:ATP-dependent DNA helicase RecG
MITKEELLALMADLESDRVERTRATRDTDKFSIAGCAFANDMPGHGKPGYLLVGVEDDGKPSGLQVTDDLLQRLAALRSDGNILPMPTLHVARFALDGGDVAVCEVMPHHMPPVRYKGQVWIRTGPRRGIANEDEERRLSERRASQAGTWDAQPCTDARLIDLDYAFFDFYRRKAVAADVIEKNHRTIEEQLAALRFYDLKRDCPTNAGVVLFAKDPPYFFPGAFTQCLRFPGTSKGQKPTQAVPAWRTGLVETLQRLDYWIDANLTHRLTPAHEGSMREQTVVDYPKWAVRELAINALVHRDHQSTAPVHLYWYADRIEIDNPGGPYGAMTPATFGRTAAYRNPIIAEAVKTLGFVNRFGFGIINAKELLHANNNPPPTWEVDEHFVQVIIPAAPLPPL